MDIEPVAYYDGLFDEKFGVPKQSGLASSVRGRVIMEPKFRSSDFFRGIDGFSHLWLLWGFSENSRAPKSPLVRPPLLGGNRKVGVFASRSPYRPNPIGLSVVGFGGIEYDVELGTVLHVAGADLANGTPIFDIKPYIPLADAITDARGGFTDDTPISYLDVKLSSELRQSLSPIEADALTEALRLDPRPHYHDSPARVYTFTFAGREVAFRVVGGTAMATLKHV